MPYYIQIRGKTFGPFDDAQLKEMQVKGKLSRASNVSENKIDWFSADRLEFLFPKPVPIRQPAPTSTAYQAQTQEQNNDTKIPAYSAQYHEQPLWFYSINGNEGFGPVTQLAIEKMIQAGTLHAESIVWQQGQNANEIRGVAPFDKFFESTDSQKGWFRLLITIGACVGLVVLVAGIIVGVMFLIDGNGNGGSGNEQAGQSKVMESGIENILAKAELSVAIIRGRGGHGTGFLVRPGILVTNKHVIDGEFLELVTVHFPSADTASNRVPLVPKLLYKDPDLDLAFLQVDTKLPAMSVVSEHEFKRGQKVVAIGNPGIGDNVMEVAVSEGLLSSQTLINNHSFYQLSMSINAGNSGGPVIDLTGKVIGVATLKARTEKGTEGIAFCIPSTNMLRSIDMIAGITDREKDKNNSLHRARVATILMSHANFRHHLCMLTYINAMEEADERGKSARDGINNVKTKVEKEMEKIKYVFLEDTERELSKITSDQNLDKSIRENIKSYHRICMVEKRYIEDPPYDSVRNYKDKLSEWVEKTNQLKDELRSDLGISKEEVYDMN
ncbi:MAG: trypsin-like peptidase domain-containing protein [Planctomycetaceae bacterium]|jgi:S1-C subfamily serine protease|nr:trypsin-like peptidase domain-containing protein [Planctomycetaceae bacterium]